MFAQQIITGRRRRLAPNLIVDMYFARLSKPNAANYMQINAMLVDVGSSPFCSKRSN